MNEIEELKDTIEMLKEELLLLQDKHDKDYKLLNERLDYLSTAMINPSDPNKSE